MEEVGVSVIGRRQPKVVQPKIRWRKLRID